MRIFALVTFLSLAFLLTPVQAQQGPDDQYIQIYGTIQQAEALVATGQPRQALAAFLEARNQLQTFSKVYPEWSPSLVTFRLKYLAEKITATTALVPADTAVKLQNAAAPGTTPSAAGSPSMAPAETNAAPVEDAQLAELRTQVQNLQADNATLAAKLKEALSAQPSAADPRELAAAQEKVRSLMKENDLLQVSLSQRQASAEKGGSKTESNALAKAQRALADMKKERDDLRDQLNTALKAGSAKPNRSEANSRVAQLTKQLEILQARLAVDEAKPVPYTDEELALFRQTAPEPQAAAAAPKSVRELPAGAADLVASAQAHFAAKEYDQAAADYQKILQMDANNALVLANLAAIELQQGRLADAEKHIQAAVARDPDDAYNLSILGNLKFQQQKYDEALDILSRAAKLDPQNPRIQNFLGAALGHKGLHLQAETALRKALLLDPNFGDAHNNLAVIYANEQPPRAELARWHYLKALAAGQAHNPGLEKILADNGAPVPAQ
jgi:tetratricopeptide (TPR) repeat protein